MRRKTTNRRFAICIANQDCDDLAVWKVYRIIPDDMAAQEDFLRIVDESGEDYLYPKNRFVVVDLPQVVVEKLLAIPTSNGA
jgi:hypothetical protein